MATRTRLALLLVIIGRYQWQVTTLPVLTPSTMLSACPGDEVVVKCVESETTTRISLRWIITPINMTIHKIELSLSNLMNNTNRLDARLQFYAELTSYYPLSSILTATAHPALDGATVTCITLTSRDSLIIRVAQIDHPEIQWPWLNVTGGWFGEDNLTVVIEWEGNSDCLDFAVSFTSPTDSSSNYNITTKNRSHTFSIFYNTNYTATVASSSGNSSSEISKTFNIIKCEPPPQQENVTVSGYISPALENAQVNLSCLPGYSFLDTNETTTVTITSTCTSEAKWSPDLVDLECRGSSQWLPHPDTTRLHTTAPATTNGLGWTVALGVGVPLILACLCFVGIATATVLSCLAVRRRKGSIEKDDKQSDEDLQNRDDHTIEHWGIYSLLAQPEAGSTRNSAVYAEIGHKAIPQVAKGGASAVVMPNTSVQYAVVKKKRSTAEQREQNATDVVSHLDELLLKLPHSQVSPKWRQFGFAVRVPVETLDELSSYQEEERRLSEIADYWMKQHQGRLTWREVARIMKEIDLNDLAGEILRDCERTANGDAVGHQNDTSQDQQYQNIPEVRPAVDLSDEHERENGDTTTQQDSTAALSHAGLKGYVTEHVQHNA